MAHNTLWTHSLSGKREVSARRPALHGGALYSVFLYRKGSFYESTLLNLNADSGQPRWEFRVEHVVNQPIVGPEGVIYLSSFEGAVYAVSPEGKQLWRAKVSDRNIGVPCIVDGGQLAVAEIGGGASRTYGINRRNGELLWQADTGGHAYAIARGGSKLVHSAVSPTGVGVNLFCLDALQKGKQLWQRPNDQYLFRPVIADEVIYIGARHSARAYDLASGDLRGEFALTGDATVNADLLLNSGRLYFGDDRGVLRALNVLDPARPALMWEYQADSEVVAQPLIFDDEVFFVSRIGTLYGLNPDTGRERTRIALKTDEDAGGMAASGSRLYVAHGRAVACIDQLR